MSGIEMALFSVTVCMAGVLEMAYGCPERSVRPNGTGVQRRQGWPKARPDVRWNDVLEAQATSPCLGAEQRAGTLRRPVRCPDGYFMALVCLCLAHRALTPFSLHRQALGTSCERLQGCRTQALLDREERYALLWWRG